MTTTNAVYPHVHPMSGRMMSVYEERYQIPLLAALILLAIEAALLDRRRDAAAPAKREPEKEAA